MLLAALEFARTAPLLLRHEGLERCVRILERPMQCGHLLAQLSFRLLPTPQQRFRLVSRHVGKGLRPPMLGEALLGEVLTTAHLLKLGALALHQLPQRRLGVLHDQKLLLQRRTGRLRAQ